VIQPIVRALPLTAAIDAMRGNMLQGSAVEAVAEAGAHDVLADAEFAGEQLFGQMI
jgi:hypothetical protein